MPAFELRTVAPLRCANILAAVAFVLYGVLGLLLAPFLLVLFTLMNKFGPMTGPGHRPPSPPDLFPSFGLAILLLIFYPILGAVMGWVVGALGSFTYNMVVRLTGGIVVRLEPAEPTAV